MIHNSVYKLFRFSETRLVCFGAELMGQAQEKSKDNTENVPPEVKPLGEHADYLYNWASISDGKENDIKDSVRKELKLPPNVAVRPLTLTVRTEGDVTTIKVIDRMTKKEMGEIKVSQEKKLVTSIIRQTLVIDELNK